jgi:uncharacterized Zn finger protein (UPF0148 family)
MAQQDTGKVTCGLCGATFNTVEERQRHNEQQHPKEMARVLDRLSDVLAEKGVITQADWEKNIKQNLSAK